MEQYLAIGFLVSVNLATFGVFWFDRVSAVEGRRRVSESKMLLFAFLGGWAGAKLAQSALRHKTRKQPFGKMLNCIPLVWIAGASLVGAWTTLPQAPGAEPVVTETSQVEPVATFERETPKFFQSVQN